MCIPCGYFLRTHVHGSAMVVSVSTKSWSNLFQLSFLFFRVWWQGIKHWKGLRVQVPIGLCECTWQVCVNLLRGILAPLFLLYLSVESAHLAHSHFLFIHGRLCGHHVPSEHSSIWLWSQPIWLTVIIRSFVVDRAVITFRLTILLSVGRVSPSGSQSLSVHSWSTVRSTRSVWQDSVDSG